LRLLGAVFVTASVVLASLLGGQSASANPAFPNLILLEHPTAITNSATARFVFLSFGDPTECQFDGGSFDTCVSPYTTPMLTEGSHTFTVHVIGATASQGTSSFSWTSYTLPSLSGGSAVSGHTNSVIGISDLQISGASNDSLTIKLSTGSGSLHMATSSGLSFTGSSNGPVLEFSGSRSNLNTALATLTYIPDSAGNKSITAYIEGKDGERYNTVDGRVFQVVNSGGLSWSDSKTAAEASTYGGAQGYLASVMDLDQANLISERITDQTWLGGSDAANEGDWRWMSGPEAGTAFWNGDLNGAAVGSAYTNWAGGMPDNYNGNENCTETYPGSPVTWNDQDCSQPRSYYVVEYGDGVTIPYIDTRNIAVTVAPANPIIKTVGTSIIHTAQSYGNADTNKGVASSSDTVHTAPQDSIKLATKTVGNPVITQSKSKVVAYTFSLGSFGLLLLLAIFFWRKNRLPTNASSK